MRGRICVAEIRNKIVRVFPMEFQPYHTLQMLEPNGMQFSDERSLLGLSWLVQMPLKDSSGINKQEHAKLHDWQYGNCLCRVGNMILRLL